MKFYLGIDLGLSGARAAVVDSTGRLLGGGRHGSGNVVNNAAEQMPQSWLPAIAEAIDLARRAAGDPPIEAIGVGAFGPCAIPVNERLQPTGAASLFAFDTRHEPWRRRHLDAGIDEADIGPDHTLPKIERLRDVDPERFARSALVLDATGFVVATLTGVAAMDPITRMDHALPGMDTPLPLPPVRHAASVAGVVSKQAAERFRLTAGTPVAVGTHDSYVDLFGAGISASGDAGMLLGSTAVICKVAEPRNELGALRVTPHVGDGTMVGGWTSAAGSLLSWATEVTTAATPANGHHRPAPGSGGLIMLPYFAGERAPIWDQAARGALVGMTLSTTGDDIRVAALEAVALSIMDIVLRLDDVCGETAGFRVAGGGAAIPGLVEAIASATCAELEIVADPGEACAGAVLAAHAVGAPIHRASQRLVRPRPADSERFGRLLDIYRPLYGHLADAMHRLGELASGKEH